MELRRFVLFTPTGDKIIEKKDKNERGTWQPEEVSFPLTKDDSYPFRAEGALSEYRYSQKVWFSLHNSGGDHISVWRF